MTMNAIESDLAGVKIFIKTKYINNSSKVSVGDLYDIRKHYLSNNNLLDVKCKGKFYRLKYNLPRLSKEKTLVCLQEKFAFQDAMVSILIEKAMHQVKYQIDDTKSISLTITYEDGSVRKIDIA
jgi:hypothetical protein